MRLKWVIIPFCRRSKILGEAGKQEILQQMFRKFLFSNRLPNRYFPENCRRVPLRTLLKSRPTSQRWVYALWESPNPTPDPAPLNGLFNSTWTFRSDSDFLSPYGSYKELSEEEKVEKMKNIPDCSQGKLNLWLGWLVIVALNLEWRLFKTWKNTSRSISLEIVLEKDVQIRHLIALKSLNSICHSRTLYVKTTSPKSIGEGLVSLCLFTVLIAVLKTCQSGQFTSKHKNM